jgi:hypothetical protein
MTHTIKKNGKTVKIIDKPKTDAMTSILNKKKAVVLQNQKERRMS